MKWVHLWSGAALSVLSGTVGIACAGVSPFGGCFSEIVEVSMPASVSKDGVTEKVLLSDRVASTNLPGGDFDGLAGVTGNASVSTGVIVWTVPSPGGWMWFELETPVEQGDEFHVENLGGSGGGWGWSPGATTTSGQRAEAYFVGRNNVANTQPGSGQEDVIYSVEGVLVVVNTIPLHLRVDLTFYDPRPFRVWASGQPGNDPDTVVQVNGDMTFGFTKEKQACD